VVVVDDGAREDVVDAVVGAAPPTVSIADGTVASVGICMRYSPAASGGIVKSIELLSGAVGLVYKALRRSTWGNGVAVAIVTFGIVAPLAVAACATTGADKVEIVTSAETTRFVVGFIIPSVITALIACSSGT